MHPDFSPCIATASSGAPIVLTEAERKRHVFLLGKSGSGKSTVLFNLVMADIFAGRGVAVIDPHGDLAEAIIDAMPRSRVHDVCYLDVSDTEHPVGFNPLAGVPARRHALAASGVVAAFKHLWGDSWGPRLEHFLYNGVAALLASPRPTLIDLPRLFIDDRFRERIIARITEPIAQRFWYEEFPSYEEKFRIEASAPILNKAGQFSASPAVRNILGQQCPKFDLAFAMDNQRIFVANLAKGAIGEQASNLLGSLIVSHLQLITMARSDRPERDRTPFLCHIDELQNFSTDSFAGLLSEARKFGIHFSLATQYSTQLSQRLFSAIAGNVGTLLIFRVSAADAELLAPEFHPLPAHELIDQPPYRAWLRRIDAGCRPVQIEPPLFAARQARARVVATSRRKFARPREAIERSFASRPIRNVAAQPNHSSRRSKRR